MLRTVMLGSVKDACSRAGTELSFVRPQKLARLQGSQERGIAFQRGETHRKESCGLLAPRKHAACSLL